MFSNKKLKIKHRLFDQSYAVDRVLAKTILNQEGFASVKLSYPILYRGDTRQPKEIFKKGFYRRIDDEKKVKSGYLMPSISKIRASVNCVPASTDLICAVGFADCPDHTPQKPDHSWVYMLYVREGIPLADDSLYNKCETNKARLVNEVTLTGVAPENIIAAFQIKTTAFNRISHYYNQLSFYTYNEAEAINWKIKITDFVINDHCVLKLHDPEFYQKMINEFSENYKRGYIKNPLCPFRDKDSLPMPNDMTPLQMEAYSTGYIMTLEDLKKITYQEQVSAIKLGFPIHDVVSDWFGKQHLFACENWIAVEKLRNTTEIEAYGLGIGLSYEQVKGMTTIDQANQLLHANGLKK